MNSKDYNKSQLWKINLKKNFHNFNLQNFREVGGPNKKLGSWDPMESSLRYFKSLLYAFADHLDTTIRENLKTLESSDSKNRGAGVNFYLEKVNKMNLGNPVTINFYGQELSIDYVLSVEEMYFLDATLKNSKTVLEIGAGFGRLAHSVLENFDNIDEYIICDLPEMLAVSENFLSTVLTKENFSKISFFPNDQFKFISNADLCINIDSFQEMSSEVVENYITGISSYAKYFYSKNAICKYNPSLIGVQINDSGEYNSAMEQGLCTDEFDIYKSSDLIKAQEIYLEKYCPNNFNLLKDKQSFGQYLFYHSALFQRN